MTARIDTNELLAILNDWNSWNKELATGVPRPLYSRKLQRLMEGRQVLDIR